MTAPQTELGNEIAREWRKNEEERESEKKREKGEGGWKEDGRRMEGGWGERGRREEKRILKN